jgi:hypothetical protein
MVFAEDDPQAVLQCELFDGEVGQRERWRQVANLRFFRGQKSGAGGQ